MSAEQVRRHLTEAMSPSPQFEDHKALAMTISKDEPPASAAGYEKGWVWRRVGADGGGMWINEGTFAEATWAPVDTN